MWDPIRWIFLKATTELEVMDGASQWTDKEGLDSISIWGDTLVHSNLIMNAPNPPFIQHPLTNLPAVATNRGD